MTAILRYSKNLYYSDLLEINRNNMNEELFLNTLVTKENNNINMILFLLKRTNKISGRKNIANVLINYF